MAKFTFTYLLLLVLLLSVVSMVPQANAQKRCIETLYSSGCTLYDCGQKCYQKHHQYGGQCISNKAQTDYSCVCVWTCGADD
ncbi:hypothetical protein SLEP1_g35273 [Rubroshorea leprosula]|uniref:Uncharacterized protein n=1 Tax=Rubroshorea leprosula TaxID=152421 RepID=A0AAV5KMQ1_9ROSI|nr:hypothetical protein SLEP1_g35273 [Rubroshorea leprosula]